MHFPHIVEATAQNFTSEVLERSAEVPVLVDFWADWCNPCKMLTPVLAQLAEELSGSIVLATVNTEEQQELAMQHGIRSLPTVKLFRNGAVVDEFMGALPEAQVRAFLNPHLERRSDSLLAEAQAQAASGALDAAVAQAAAAHAEDPDNHRVTIGYAQVLLTAGRPDDARDLVKQLPAGEQESEAGKRLAAILSFAEVAVDAAPLAELDHTLASEPDNSDARYAAAAHEVLNGNYEQAMLHLFEIFQRDRQYADDAARKGLIAVFELAGDSASVTDYRRRMFAMLH
jgi:putative thioredoxin